jgi:hypothetical protein
MGASELFSRQFVPHLFFTYLFIRVTILMDLIKIEPVKIEICVFLCLVTKYICVKIWTDF